ncbi:hypothetical protein [Clostridium perfringens]|uniref:Uncharacterized protein n=1 Tax=Clostridium perfringens TaxID=1502 RepID=A0A4Y5T4Q8_CLOPF|nr:hypothetical protein [Clostridium perfringens]QDB01302.1 hypothetical protein [Clostridium perfringens]HAT4221947.1 hypothetical protein [Clostridium perfringens]
MVFFKNTIKKIFFSIDKSFLIKYYSISIAIFLIFLFGTLNSGIRSLNDVYGIFFLTISAILFPFSVLVWNSIVNLFFNNSVILLPVVFMILFKIIKVILLYAFSIFIAPFGILYVYIKTK